MEIFSALLAICVGNSPVASEFPAQRPVTRSFDVFFDLRPNKRLSKQSLGWWFETPSHSLWRQCNDNLSPILSSLVVPAVAVTTAPASTSGYKVGIMTPLGFSWNNLATLCSSRKTLKPKVPPCEVRLYSLLLGTIRLSVGWPAHFTVSFLNSLWSSDAIWRLRSGTTLAQVMACCLTAPSHYLNQCWLTINFVQWHSYEGSFTRDTSAIDH